MQRVVIIVVLLVVVIFEFDVVIVLSLFVEAGPAGQSMPSLVAASVILCLLSFIPLVFALAAHEA